MCGDVTCACICVSELSNSVLPLPTPQLKKKNDPSFITLEGPSLLFSPTTLACGVLTVQEGYRLGICERAVSLVVNLVVNLVVKLVVNLNLVVNIVVNLVGNLVINTLSRKRLDGKRHYVI